MEGYLVRGHAAAGVRSINREPCPKETQAAARTPLKLAERPPAAYQLMYVAFGGLAMKRPAQFVLLPLVKLERIDRLERPAMVHL